MWLRMGTARCTSVWYIYYVWDLCKQIAQTKCSCILEEFIASQEATDSKIHLFTCEACVVLLDIMKKTLKIVLEFCRVRYLESRIVYYVLPDALYELALHGGRRSFSHF